MNIKKKSSNNYMGKKFQDYYKQYSTVNLRSYSWKKKRVNMHKRASSCF